MEARKRKKPQVSRDPKIKIPKMEVVNNFRGLYPDELTDYVELVLGFSEVVNTFVSHKTGNGQSYVFIQAGFVVLQLYDDGKLTLCIPGYSKDPLVTVTNLDKKKFESVLQTADIIFIPIVIVCHHESPPNNSDGHCNLLVYRKLDKKYFLFDTLLTSKKAVQVHTCISARIVEEQVVPILNNTFSLPGKSTKCWSSSLFPVEGGCGIYALWCVEQFLKLPTWDPQPHFLLPAPEILTKYAKDLAQKLAVYEIDLTKKR